MSNVEALSRLLVETATHHGAYEAVAPPHAWPDWYAAYMDARQTGSTPDEASAAAGRYMAEVKHVVVAPRLTPAGIAEPETTRSPAQQCREGGIR